MPIIPVKTPEFVKTLFPNVIWNVNTKNKDLYLTFDDGPTPEITDWVLNTLKPFNAKATFFCIGSNIEKHPDIFDRIIADGHTIGNHTYNHLKGWSVNTDTYTKDVQKTQILIDGDNSTKDRLKLFRPPYGKFKNSQNTQLRNSGYTTVLWDVLSYDWEYKISKEKCLNNVIKNATEGSIVVFHDSEKAFKNLEYVLPKAIDYFYNKGYKFKAITQECFI